MYTQPGSGSRRGDNFVAGPGPGPSDSLSVFRRNAPAGSTPAFARPARRSCDIVHGWAAARRPAALGALILRATDLQAYGEVFRKGGGEGFAPVTPGGGGRRPANRSPWLSRGKSDASLNPSPGETRDIRARRFFPCVKARWSFPCVKMRWSFPCAKTLSPVLNPSIQDFLISA